MDCLRHHGLYPAQVMSSSLSFSSGQPSLSHTFHSDSSGLSNDTLSIEPLKGLGQNTRKVASLEYLYHIPAVMSTNEYPVKKRSRSSIILCRSKPIASAVTKANKLSSESQHSSQSSRIKELKTKLRSIELQYYRRKRQPTDRQKVQSIKKNALYDSRNELVGCGLYQTYFKHESRMKLTIQCLIEVVWRALCINTVTLMFYLLFMFYKYSLSILVQSTFEG